MTQEELQQQIGFYYAKLPVEAQEVFSSMKWLEAVKGISATYSLNTEQQQSLGTETTLMMLGVTSIGEYEDTVKNKMAISKDIAEKIYKEIEENVIKNIRPQLSTAFQKNTEVIPESNNLIASDLDERFKKLPAVVKDAINESDYKAMIYAIAQKQGLTVDQIGKLEINTADLMLGTTSTDTFANIVQADLAITPEKTKEIVDEINEKILKKIRAVMMTPAKEETHNELLESREDMLKHIENPSMIPAEKKDMLPILAQKLTSSFQIPATKTEHTMVNLSPEGSRPTTPVITTPPSPAEAPKTYPPKADPYRIAPEE